MTLDLGAASQIASILYYVGLLGGGGWAVYTYNRSARTSATRWGLELFQRFYMEPLFAKSREWIEYEFDDRVQLLMQMRITDSYMALSDSEKRELQQFDNLLNYLEAVMYIVDNKQITSSDADAFFDYWFSLLADDKRAIVRRYLKLGFERLARRIGVCSDSFVFLHDPQRERAAGEIRSLDLRLLSGAYAPHGIPNGVGQMIAEVGAGSVYRIPRDSELAVVRALDAAFGYQAATDGQCPVKRRMVCVHPVKIARGRSIPKRVDAWAYHG